MRVEIRFAAIHSFGLSFETPFLDHTESRKTNHVGGAAPRIVVVRSDYLKASTAAFITAVIDSPAEACSDDDIRR